MNRSLISMGISICLAMGMSTATFAMSSPDDAGGLNLRPLPQEVTLHEGGFRLTPDTKILVQFGHQTEDRIAAETLAEEIADQSGLKLDIIGSKEDGKAEDGAIVLARLQDRRVRRFLASKGLQADRLVGEQGYLLFSDKSHLVVAANTGEGLFYGVQTLRQLLRPAGKALVCPSVAIRDWPKPVLQDPRSRGDLSKDQAPVLIPQPR